MKKLVTFASDIRLNALLCCSATVLLTACGGAMNDTGSLQSQTAAYVQSDVADTDANSAATTPNAADAAAAQATEVAGNSNFELVGYDTNPLTASTADAAAAPASQDAAAAEAAP